jgi:STE24 endopeptidase
MATFDPAAATIAYLHMIDPVREARAIAYTQGSHWLILWGWLATLAADVLIIRSAILPRLRARIEKERPRPNLVAFLCVALLVLMSWAIRLPWTVYADWWRERSYGLSNEAFGAGFTQNMISTIISAIALGLMAIPVYALMRRAGRNWLAWISGIVAIFSFLAVVVAPAALAPVFNASHPAPTGPIRAAVEELASRAGIPSNRIVVIDGSKQSSRYTATVVGGPGFATIEMSDTMFAGDADIAETRAVVAHEIGHYVHYHLVLLAILLWLLITIGLWCVDRLFLRLAIYMPGGEAVEMSNPALAPVIQILLATFMILTSPVIATTERLVESDADAYGLALANEPDGMARALLRTVDFRASSPGPVEEALFYDHPSIAHRIRAAMDWKAQHPVNPR